MAYRGALMLTLALCAHAQTGVVVSGSVEDTLGSPVVGARVTLAVADTTVYTDTAGAFAIVNGNLRANGRAISGVAGWRLDLARDGLVLTLVCPARVSWTLLDIAGRSCSRGAERLLTAGPHRLVDNRDIPAAGLYVLALAVDGRWQHTRVLSGLSGLNFQASTGSVAGIRSLSRRLATLDTLVVGKLGYLTTRVDVDALPGTYPHIVLRADSIEWRVDSLLSRMTVGEKLGQMIQADMDSVLRTTDVKDLTLGSLISGATTTHARDPAGWADLSDQLQAQAAQTRLRIPLLIGVDAVHGHNNCQGAVMLPHNIGLGCTRNPQLVQEAWQMAAQEVAATGCNWTFAPCIAVPRDERWGRTYEGFGETPDLAALMGPAATQGLQSAGTFGGGAIAACLKHFVGDGGTAWGTGKNGMIDEGEAMGGEATLRAIHLPGYIAAVHAGAYTVMCSYSSWDKPDTSVPEDMHGSYFWLTGVLKGELGFSGFIITDNVGFTTIKVPTAPNDSVRFRDQVMIAANAGIDMFMASTQYAQTLADLQSLVTQGAVPLARIDDAVRRILRVKYHLGLFDKSTVDRTLTAAVGSAAHRAIGRDCVRQSCVLLKNDGGHLPLRKSGQKIAIVGFHADSLPLQCGGWSMGWSTPVAPITGGTTILSAVRSAVTVPSNIIVSLNGTGIDSADIAVVVSGEQAYAEWTGDIANPRLPTWTRTMIDNCHKTGKPVVLVLISGRPLLFEGYDQKCDAILAAWLPGTEGAGVADVLFGDYAPTGKLSHTWADTLTQIPINVGDAGYSPKYPYGYGLTY